MATVSNSARPSLPNLTTLRFFAAFSVFLHHLDGLGLHASRHVWGVNLGWTVSFFFVLSGFVLAYSYDGRINGGRGVASFIGQRLVRLWPVHGVCLLLLALALGVSDVNWAQAYLVLTLQQAWLPAYGSAFALNGVAWSISVELFFYLLFPFLIVLPVRKLLIVFLVVLGGIVGSIVFLSNYGGPVFPNPVGDPLWFRSFEVTPSSFLLFFPPIRLGEFIAGILTYHVYRRVRVPVGMVTLVQIATIAATIGYMTQHASLVSAVQELFSDAASQAYRQFGAFPLFAVIVFVFAHQSGPVSAVFSNRWLVFLGEISFAFYMVHQIVIRYVGSTSLSGSEAAFMAFALSLAAATILHFGVERPAMKWVKGRSRSADSRSASEKLSPISPPRSLPA